MDFEPCQRDRSTDNRAQPSDERADEDPLPVLPHTVA
jgi:hypothetical protein